MSNVQINNLIIQIQKQLIKIKIIIKTGHIIVVLVVEEVGCRHFIIEQVLYLIKMLPTFEFNDKQLYIIIMKNNSEQSRFVYL